MQYITMNMQKMAHHHYNFDCYAYLTTLRIPDFILQNLTLLSPTLAYSLRKIAKQKDFDPNFSYFGLYLQFRSLVSGNSRTLLDNQRAELLKELASIDGRKKFIAQNSNNEDYVMFLKDAIEHSSIEYQDKLKKQLRELAEFSLLLQTSFLQ